ncbi:MAG: 50S ribosomal protein L13 [Candidatus Buchananbacteria bacterium]
MDKKIVKKVKKVSKKPIINRAVIKIDATDQVLGRLACNIAKRLMGKDKATYQYHIDNGDIIYVTNVTKLKFSGKKFDQKVYYHYSGYPGGLIETPMKRLYAKDPAKILHFAVWNMLPKNKLRAQMIKRLKISK